MIAETLTAFLTAHFAVIITITIAALGAYTALAWKHLDTKFKLVQEQYSTLRGDHLRLESRLLSLEETTHSMETNYIGRFGDVKATLAQTKEEIVETIYKMEQRIKDDMFRLHNQTQSNMARQVISDRT